MEIDDQLIISPIKLKYTSPCKCGQKRLLTLTNSCNKSILYRLIQSDEKCFSIDKCSGKLEAFDTTDLAVTVEAIQNDLPQWQIELKWLIADTTAEENWSNAKAELIDICFETTISVQTDKNHLLNSQMATCTQYRRLLKMIDQKSRPVCYQCKLRNQRMLTWKQYWLRQFLWLIFILLFCGLFYYYPIGSTLWNAFH